MKIRPKKTLFEKNHNLRTSVNFRYIDPPGVVGRVGQSPTWKIVLKKWSKRYTVYHTHFNEIKKNSGAYRAPCIFLNSEAERLLYRLFDGADRLFHNFWISSPKFWFPIIRPETLSKINTLKSRVSTSLPYQLQLYYNKQWNHSITVYPIVKISFLEFAWAEKSPTQR